jgi:hypothetical protein
MLETPTVERPANAHAGPFRAESFPAHGTSTSTKGVSVRKLLFVGATAAVALAAICVPATAGASASVKIRPFSAAFSGNAVVAVEDAVATISANGTGVGSPLLMGAAKIIGNGTGSTAGVGADQPCVPFTGTGSMTGTKGKLAFKVVQGAQSCGDESQQSFAISGRAVVLSGTGKLAKAKGTLKITGTYDRSAGTFTAKFAGNLTLPK